MSPHAQKILLRRRTLVAAVAGLGICLSLAGFDLARQDHLKHLESDFARRVENHSALVREIVQNSESTLFGLRNLFVGSNQVTETEFKAAAHELIHRYPSITALEWVPVVKGPERAAVEATMSRRTGKPFEFVTNEGTRAPDADEYWPILYVEPMAGNERAFGYDLKYGPTTAALNRAKTSGNMTVSERISLIQESDSSRYSIIFIWPVTKSVGGKPTLLGYVQAVIRIADMLERPLSDSNLEPLDILYLDPIASDETHRVLYHDPAAGDSSASATEASFRAGPHREVEIAIGANQWIVLYRPNKAWLAASSTVTPYGILFGGFAITGLLAGIVQLLGRRAEVIGAEVERQTIELKESRHQLENLLLVERRMQESQKRESLGMLAGGVAHDFNNLLTTILGNATMARMDLPSGAPWAANLEQIEQAARHAAALCKQMLAYAGKGQLIKETVDINRVIRNLLPLLQSSAGNNVKLNFNDTGNAPGIHADPTEISQIVMNLVINAAEAIEGAEGIVTINTTTQDVTETELRHCSVGSELTGGRYLALKIEDNGPGMSAAVLKRIFDPFFSTKFEGRGLGLAAVLGIVRGHHGALHVESTPGYGTCFTIWFPLNADTDSTQLPKTALVVDDDEAICEMSCALFRSFGYEAEAVNSGAQAIEKIRAQPNGFGVVLLDCVMPKMTGEETLHELRKVRPGLPVILMSGNNERGAAAHGAPFITKPFSRATLEQTLVNLQA